MEICVPYVFNPPYSEDDIGQYNISYDPQDSNFKKLMEFIKTYKDKRINVSFRNEFDKSIAETLITMFDNVYIRLDKDTRTKLFDREVQKTLYRRFFVDTSFSASSWSALNFLIESGVSDVFISNDLSYDLANVRRYCDKAKINMRVVINQIQNTNNDGWLGSKIVFYRPNDTEFISQYFDACEFAADTKYIKGLITAYFENENWEGNINNIVPNSFALHNNSIPPDWTGLKSSCKMRCMTGGNCHMCDNLYDIAAKLNSIGVEFPDNKIII